MKTCLTLKKKVSTYFSLGLSEREVKCITEES